jgi:hypothetical protein
VEFCFRFAENYLSQFELIKIKPTKTNPMKKILLAALFIISISVKSQSTSTTATCTSMAFLGDFSHYNVLPTHDSAFVRYVQFNLSDTSSVAKISYTFSDVTTATAVQQAQKNYVFQTTTNSSDLTVATNFIRNQKIIKISFGYLQYQRKKYLANIKLYDSNNTLLSSTDFNFAY